MGIQGFQTGGSTMMQKTISIFLLCLLALLSGCSQDTPQNFVCKDKDGGVQPKSLTVTTKKAIFGTDTFAQFCKSRGNSTFFGEGPRDCKNVESPSSGEYASLEFDVISGSLIVKMSVPQRQFFRLYTYQCEKVKS